MGINFCGFIEILGIQGSINLWPMIIPIQYVIWNCTSMNEHQISNQLKNKIPKYWWSHIIPWFALMSLFPSSKVTMAVPFRTMSTTVLQALGDSRSVGDIKFPAALLITMSGKPNSCSQRSAAVFTLSGSRTSAATASTCKT